MSKVRNPKRAVSLQYTRGPLGALVSRRQQRVWRWMDTSSKCLHLPPASIKALINATLHMSPDAPITQTIPPCTCSDCDPCIRDKSHLQNSSISSVAFRKSRLQVCAHISRVVWTEDVTLSCHLSTRVPVSVTPRRADTSCFLTRDLVKPVAYKNHKKKEIHK